MRQAKTLKDAEIKRVLAYCATRQHAQRDTTIFVFSLHAGLRAKELAALRICDVYDDAGNVHKFICAVCSSNQRCSHTHCIRQQNTQTPTSPILPNTTQTAHSATVLQSKRQLLQRQHNVPTSAVHLQNVQFERRKFAQRQTHVYNTLGKQRCWCACACRTCWAQQHCNNTAIH